SSSEQIKAQIRAREKYEMDKASEIATAKNEGLIEGEKKGIEKGLIEGEKKGIQKGKQEGLIEGEKKGKNEAKKELAQNMRNQGFEDTVITKCLNINIEELNKLLA
ncbi:MAG: hypothetical protein IJ848_01515, partial [Alphaproteobacteria bacterium]|nr:hypothetical protein [Alphaproteobacteria bacterium]